MPRPAVNRPPVARWAWALVALAAVLALAPWWRNRGYVRSLFDYGVPMGAAGRIADGQRPYVDFVTPTQAGWFWLNRLAEKTGDGTYQAMTLGGAVATLIALAGMAAILAHRWPLPAATAVAGALVCATTAQHTLLWYNPWGVFLLAVVAWAGALAPVLRREHWPWHALAAAAFFFGGINKINMQLMAFGLACAWAVRAGLVGRAGWGRVGATLLFYLGCLVPPVLAEMAWTGATFAIWWHNVVALPAAARSGMVWAALSWNFLFQPVHDYYGPMPLRAIGLTGVVLTGATVVAILRKTWREAGWLEKILPVACGAVALLGGAVLLTTNMDIAYIGLAGWLALLVGLWLGYELPAAGVWFYGTLVLPVVLVGIIAWQSAWQGQRSQFGHSSALRADYLPGERAGPDFAYLRGTRLPPELVQSLRDMAVWRQSLEPARRARHYFGPGTEWAAHIWPALRTPGLPFYMQAGHSYGEAEQTRLYTALSSSELSEITVSQVLDLWGDRERVLLMHRFEKRQIGPMFSVYSRVVNEGMSIMPVWFTRTFGGNADSRFLASEMPFQQMSDWRMFVGVTAGTGTMQFTRPTNRLNGEAVVRRVTGASRVAAAADFAIYAQPDAATRYPRWAHHVELPADQDEIIVPYAIDSSHMPTTFTVEIPPKWKGVVAAGWRNPHIQHSGGNDPATPDWFFRGAAQVTSLDDAALAKLLPGGWRPKQAFMRHGRVTADGIELSPGGEIWLQVDKGVAEFAGTATDITPQDTGLRPLVRGMWYNSGRLEVFTETPVRDSDRAADFHGWCAEPGGWLIVAVDPSFVAPAVRVRVHRVNERK